MADDDARLMLADRTHHYRGTPKSILFDVLADTSWVVLQRGEVRPVVIESVPGERVVWSSFWPVSPDDTVEFDLAGIGDDSSLRLRWFSTSPPDDKGIQLTRQRLNRKIGADLRGQLVGD